jgi:hypothetical protein
MTDLAQATALIDAGKPLAEIRACFDSTADAYEFFAEKATRDFSVEKARDGRTCHLCGNTATRVQCIHWRAIYHTMRSGIASGLFLLLGGLTNAREEVIFESHHSACTPCARKLDWRLGFTQLLKTLLFICLLLALFIFVPVLVFCAVVPFVEPSLLLNSLLLLVGASALVALVVAGFKSVWRLAVPAPLAHLGRYPFEPTKNKFVESLKG